MASGAVLIAAKGLFAKSLYSMDMTYFDVAAVRSILAVPGFALIAWFYQGKQSMTQGKLEPKHLILAAFSGLLCYYAGATANFYALTIIKASVERPLLFAYPIFVVLITSAINRELPPPRVLFVLLLTSLGVILVTGALNVALNSSQWSGMGWILFCSVTIAIYFLMSANLTQYLSSGLFTLVAMTAAAFGFLVHYQISQGWQSLSLTKETWITLMALVIFSTVLPLALMAEGVRRVGASRAALISTVGPPATAVMSYQLTGEILSIAQILGVALIIVGILGLEVRRGS